MCMRPSLAHRRRPGCRAPARRRRHHPKLSPHELPAQSASQHASTDMQHCPSTVVDAVGTSLLASIAQSGGTLTDADLSALHFLYDSHLAKALQIIDQGGVQVLTAAGSGRKLHTVAGQSAETYVVHPGHYCSCQVRRGNRALQGEAAAVDAVERRQGGACKRRQWPPCRLSHAPPAIASSNHQAFFFDVVSKGEAVACKHQLAARLAEALGKARVSTVSDLALAHLLQQ